MEDDGTSQSVVNLRSLSCELGLLDKTDGSALFSHGMYDNESLQETVNRGTRFQE